MLSGDGRGGTFFLLLRGHVAMNIVVLLRLAHCKLKIKTLNHVQVVYLV